tara:strand:+ start:3088 stop:5196 length:2109 start_codon:yes stop_codon:yes gene_type:complete
MSEPMPTMLLTLDDDALILVLTAVDTLRADAIFIALTCKRLLGIVLHMQALLDKEFWGAYCMPPSTMERTGPTTVKTHVTGFFASKERLACSQGLWLAQKVGWPFPGMTYHGNPSTVQFPDATEIPIPVLYRIVESSQWEVIHRIWFERHGKRAWDLAKHPEHAALVTFAAMTGRCDVLEELYKPGSGGRSNQDNCLSVLFTYSALRDVLAGGSWPQYEAIAGYATFGRLEEMIFRPATIGCHWSVIQWTVNKLMQKGREHNIGMLNNDFCWFGPLCIQENINRYDGDVGYRCVSNTLQRLIKDAARAGNVRMFREALERIFELWFPTRLWLASLCFKLLVHAFGMRSGLCSVAEELVAICRKHTCELCDMFRVVPHRASPYSPPPPRGSFDLECLIKAKPIVRARGFEVILRELRQRVFTPGTAEYNAWVLREAGMDPYADPWYTTNGFLVRSASRLRQEMISQLAPLGEDLTTATFRIMTRLGMRLSTAVPQDYRHRERHVAKFGGEKRDGWESGVFNLHRHVDSRSPLAIRERPNAPNAHERGMAMLLRRWMLYESGDTTERMRDYDPDSSEWPIMVHAFVGSPIATLPVIAELSDRASATKNGTLCYYLERVVTSALRMVMTDPDQMVVRRSVTNAYIALADQGYRRKMLTRDQFEQMVMLTAQHNAQMGNSLPNKGKEYTACIDAMRKCFDAADASR